MFSPRKLQSFQPFIWFTMSFPHTVSGHAGAIIYWIASPLRPPSLFTATPP